MPEPVVVVKHQTDERGMTHTHVESNIMAQPGAWKAIASILLDGVRAALEQDVREQLAQQQVALPMFVMPEGVL